jgi:hypothetical protein
MHVHGGLLVRVVLQHSSGQIQVVAGHDSVTTVTGSTSLSMTGSRTPPPASRNLHSPAW